MFSSRNKELEVWCKNYFDVEIVRETQLWPEDVDVCDNGCEMVRLDRWRGKTVILFHSGWTYRGISYGAVRNIAVKLLCMEVVNSLGMLYQ